MDLGSGAGCIEYKRAGAECEKWLFSPSLPDGIVQEKILGPKETGTGRWCYGGQMDTIVQQFLQSLPRDCF